MKSLLRLLPFLALAVCPLLAQENVERPVVKPRKIIQPVAPPRLAEMGVTTGEVRVSLGIDEAGHVTDYLVLAYTHPAMVEPVLAAVKQWEFEPPTLRGKAITVQREVTFNFESHGTVVSLVTPALFDVYMQTRFPERFSFRPRTMRELDRIPTPVTTTRPTVPKSAIGAEGDTVTVEFFIDPEGNVKMPSILSAGQMELATACVTAVREWKFEPPTVHGTPVLVRVQQTFKFQP